MSANCDERSEGTEQDGCDGRQLTLLEQLDRRQNEVITELDALNERIQQLVQQCQQVREAA